MTPVPGVQASRAISDLTHAPWVPDRYDGLVFLVTPQGLCGIYNFKRKTANERAFKSHPQTCMPLCMDIKQATEVFHRLNTFYQHSYSSQFIFQWSPGNYPKSIWACLTNVPQLQSSCIWVGLTNGPQLQSPLLNDVLRTKRDTLKEKKKKN